MSQTIAEPVVEPIAKPKSVSRQARARSQPTERYWPPLQGDWTYEDYARLPDNGMRYEVIEGNLYMSPAPRPRHQIAVGRLLVTLMIYLDANALGEVLTSPIDVRFPKAADPVQPDIVFIPAERRDMIQEKWIEGVPDLLVEALSPTRPGNDRRIKFDAYARAGVPEYWIVDPEARTIEVYVLRGEAYALLAAFGAEEEIRSEVLPGFTVKVGAVCPK